MPSARIILLTHLFFIGLLSCQDEPTPPLLIQEGDRFVYLFVETEQDCLALQPQGGAFFNCHHEINILENNKVSIILADIVRPGRYILDKNKLRILVGEDFVFYSELNFILQENGSLKSLDTDLIWKRVTGDSIWD